MTGPQFDGSVIERAVMRDLKGFQRRTVEYVFDRLYAKNNPARRFLVADEVGLGKTLVAKGVIAKAIRQLQAKGVERIDIIYICSNAEIANQNIRRLNVTGDQSISVSTRITMLPAQLQRLNDRGINFISFTPGTSFNMRSRTGLSDERAVIFRLLEYALDESLEQRTAAFEVLRSGQQLHHFRWKVSATGGVRSGAQGALDPTLADYFRHDICERPELIHRFRDFMEREEQREQVPHVWEKNRLIGELRQTLARSCVDALEPDLVIIDEFQRFRELLEPPNEDDPDDLRALAHKLFEQNDVRVLMLSATPYKMYTLADDEVDDHYRDFLQTCRFLMVEEQASALEVELRQFNEALRSFDSAAPERLLERKRAVEKRLRRSMVRTERLSVSDDRNGMLSEKSMAETRLDAADLPAFAAVDTISQHLRAGDVVDYWKSAPYLLNFMGDYKLKRELRDALVHAQPNDDLIQAVRKSPIIHRESVERYASIEPGNARLRALAAQTVDAGMWRLLWLPPSLPYYRGLGAYAWPDLQQATKRLIFSSWNMVPDAVSAMLSYEAERQMMLSRNSETTNTVEERRRSTGLLSIRRQHDQPAGMSTFSLLYPAATLANLTDPLAIARALGGATRLVGADEIRAYAEREVRRALEPLLGSATSSGNEDQRWYWVAPLLLDRTRSDSRTRRESATWFASSTVLRSPGGGDESGEDDTSAWNDHVELARSILTSGTRSLGLGRVPADLIETTTMVGLGGPGVSALRALGRISGSPGKSPDLLQTYMRDGALRIAWGLRTLFNVPEVMALLRGGDHRSDEVYWRRVAEEGFQGNLQAVLDEFIHLIPESLGLGHEDPALRIASVANHVSAAVSLRTVTYRADDVSIVNDRAVLDKLPMRVRFAVRFGHESREESSALDRSISVRSAFNSPFWPFVLTSTSVGQEGLDFHQYCHAIVHWNLPLNPVDLEQREGRIHRYKGHAIRKNVAEKHWAAAFNQNAADPWAAMFHAAAKSVEPGGLRDISPFWVYDGSAKIERHLPILPLSKDAARMERLRKSLAIYRLVFGQPRQEDLIAYLRDKIPAEAVAELVATLQIDLSPK
jgi:hypothetical protein